MTSRITTALVLAALAGLGCGGGSGTGGAGGAASATGSGTTATSSGTTATATSGGNVASSSSGGPIAACSDVGAKDCFSNYDCPDAATRCENAGTASAPVACCLAGARGTKAVGEACTSENDCASSLCLDTGSGSLCSDKCAGPADCVPALSKCIVIAFLGSNDKFCTP